MGTLSDEIERMVHAFDDHGRKSAVRFLAAKVAVMESTLEAISGLPGQWYQCAAEGDVSAEECADELRVALTQLDGVDAL